MEREAIDFAVSVKKRILRTLERRQCSALENTLHTLLSESLALNELLDTGKISRRQWNESNAASCSEIRSLID
jgi:hypothetical protein